MLGWLRRLYERRFGVFVYGHERTIHGTSLVNVVLDEQGKVTEVWFRCLQLPFDVSLEGTGKALYGKPDFGPPIKAVEVDDREFGR